MKKIAMMLALMTVSLTAGAQTVYFWKNNVAMAVEPGTAGDMYYSENGNSLTVIDTLMSVQNIDSITLGETVDESTVKVAYNGETATAVVPFALARKVSLTLDGAYVTATSTAVDGNDIVYSLSGTSANGSFTQNGTYKCTLALNGVSLTSQKGAAISFANGKRIKINVADGTVNNFVDYAAGEQKSCFYIKGHPEFEGTGTINVTGNKSHAISTGEYVKVDGPTINILSSANDGIHAGQYYRQKSGSVTIKNTVGDGIQADVTKDATDELNGQLMVEGGTVDITLTNADTKAMCCDSLMTISGGTITLNVKGDGTKGMATDGSLIINEEKGTTSVTITIAGGVYTDPTTLKESKTRGIKVDGDLSVLAGTLKITASGKKAKTINLDGTSTKSSSAKITLNDDFTFDNTVN